MVSVLELHYGVRLSSHDWHISFGYPISMFVIYIDILSSFIYHFYYSYGDITTTVIIKSFLIFTKFKSFKVLDELFY